MTPFRLAVRKIDRVCDFELSWGRGQTLTAQLEYPNLQRLYDLWRQAYQAFYHHLRGTVIDSGSFPAPGPDRYRQLRDAEASLLSEFHRWLLAPELAEIRTTIVCATQQSSEQGHQRVDVFLVCTSDLARLPWETWEIGTDLGAAGAVRLSRTPRNIRKDPISPIRRRLRVLAILGDNTGLNFNDDVRVLRSQLGGAEIQFFDWQQNQDRAAPDCEALRQNICQTIADERGWDILFFAGHSNETELTGGEFSIAPGVSLCLQDIAPSLRQARQRGLQLALFNSCSGIKIAESLVDLGLSQVVIMREPIHNRVAQQFLLQFLRSLACYKDVREALEDACCWLKQQENSIIYPSAYLVPSLFCHPEATLFRLEPFGFWHQVKRWLPKKREALWLSALLVIALMPMVQDLLLEVRVFVQAGYRWLTQQLPPAGTPPVFLVQIDCDRACRIAKKKLVERSERYYLHYGYLAQLLEKLSRSDAKTIGIDYILDRQRYQSPEAVDRLERSARQLAQQGIWLVFADDETAGQTVADPRWSLLGNSAFFHWYVEIPSQQPLCPDRVPFAYLLALSRVWPETQRPQPDLTRGDDFCQRIMQASRAQPQLSAFLARSRLQPATVVSQVLVQQWFQPIIDFSVPPDRIYRRISDCQVLETCSSKRLETTSESPQVALIIAGYPEAGFKEEGDEWAGTPLAVSFWQGWSEAKFSTGTAHAYIAHHLLRAHLVVPVPDCLALLLVAILGKGAALTLRDRPRQRRQWLLCFSGATALYSALSLQLYISAAVLLPCVLPAAAFWTYVRLALRRNTHD